MFNLSQIPVDEASGLNPVQPTHCAELQPVNHAEGKNAMLFCSQVNRNLFGAECPVTGRVGSAEAAVLGYGRRDVVWRVGADDSEEHIGLHFKPNFSTFDHESDADGPNWSS